MGPRKEVKVSGSKSKARLTSYSTTKILQCWRLRRRKEKGRERGWDSNRGLESKSETKDNKTKDV